MKRKLIIFIPILLITLIFFVSTTNYINAASTSTSKIISNLKKQVTVLKKSISTKDAEIKKLKKTVQLKE